MTRWLTISVCALPLAAGFATQPSTRKLEDPTADDASATRRELRALRGSQKALSPGASLEERVWASRKQSKRMRRRQQRRDERQARQSLEKERWARMERTAASGGTVKVCPKSMTCTGASEYWGFDTMLEVSVEMKVDGQACPDEARILKLVNKGTTNWKDSDCCTMPATKDSTISFELREHDKKFLLPGTTYKMMETFEQQADIGPQEQTKQIHDQSKHIDTGEFKYTIHFTPPAAAEPPAPVEGEGADGLLPKKEDEGGVLPETLEPSPPPPPSPLEPSPPPPPSPLELSPPPPPPAPVVRREIREMGQEEQERFIDAWKQIMRNGELTRLAKIHAIESVGESCVHNDETFAAWHRIYLLDLENELQKADKTLGGDGGISLPYWNTQKTRINDEVLPKIIRTHFIDQPDDTVKAFFNEECVRFTGKACGVGLMGRWPHRHPRSPSGEHCSLLSSDGSTGLPCTHSEDDLENNLQDSELDWRVGQLLGLTHHARAGGGGGASVEQPHNQVHMDVGWPMSSFAHAPFHPIFWLHHNNIDRLYEMWLQTHNDRVLLTHGDTVFGAFPFKLHGDKEGEYHYKAADAFSTEPLGYSFDSLDSGVDLERVATMVAAKHFKDAEVAAGASTPPIVFHFDDVDFTAVDSLSVEVAIVPKDTLAAKLTPNAVSTAYKAAFAKYHTASAGGEYKNLHALKALPDVFGAGYAGHVAVFSKKEPGPNEELIINLAPAFNAYAASLDDAKAKAAVADPMATLQHEAQVLFLCDEDNDPSTLDFSLCPDTFKWRSVSVGGKKHHIKKKAHDSSAAMGVAARNAPVLERHGHSHHHPMRADAPRAEAGRVHEVGAETPL